MVAESLSGRLHERRKIDSPEPDDRLGRLRERPPLRDARHAHAPLVPSRLGAGPFERHGRVYPRPAAPLNRQLPRHARRGDRRRSSAARRRRGEPRRRQSDQKRGEGPGKSRNRRERHDPGSEQDRHGGPAASGGAERTLPDGGLHQRAGGERPGRPDPRGQRPFEPRIPDRRGRGADRRRPARRLSDPRGGSPRPAVRRDRRKAFFQCRLPRHIVDKLVSRDDIAVHGAPPKEEEF